MPLRDLSEKYGRGSGHALINRAIRAELVGGDHALDAVHALDQLVHKFQERGWTIGLGHAEAALSHTRQLVSTLQAEIRRRYQIGNRPS